MKKFFNYWKTMSKVKWKATNWEKMLGNIYIWLVLKIHKEFLQVKRQSSVKMDHRLENMSSEDFLSIRIGVHYEISGNIKPQWRTSKIFRITRIKGVTTRKLVKIMNNCNIYIFLMGVAFASDIWKALW